VRSLGIDWRRTTLLYSRDAALQGVSHARPWRILAWVEAAALQ
jgi:hypothetical protein